MSVSKHKYPLIKDSLKVNIQDWITKHSFIVVYPITTGAISVRDSQTNMKANRIDEYLNKIFIQELYNMSNYGLHSPLSGNSIYFIGLSSL